MVNVMEGGMICFIRYTSLNPMKPMGVVVKIRFIIRHLIFQAPKKGSLF